MEPKVLRAHYDGKQILLDDACHLEPGMKLIITVLPVDSILGESEQWKNLSKAGLETAYSLVEPDYPLSLIKESNPGYEGK